MSKILIVEDSRTQAEQLTSVLADAGIEVVVAADGESALQMLQQTPVDLVVSDIVMPKMSGYGLCRNIKADERLKSIPVMLLSDLREPTDIINGLECGADNFLTKPYRPDQLVARVRTILENRKLRADTRLIGVEIVFLGKHFTITSEKEQILNLLVSTFEDTVQTNIELQRSQAALADAKLKLEEYAQVLEGRVRVSEEKYALLIEHANSAILIADVGGRILEANHEATTTTGRVLDDLIGCSIVDLMSLEQREPFGRCWEEMLVCGSAHVRNLTLLRPDGETVWIDVSGSRVRVGGDDFMQVIWHDVTERMRMEHQLRRSQRMEALGHLTGGIAHDFNNLLGVIVSNLDLLIECKHDDTREFAENAVSAAMRGAKLVQQLLAFACRQPLQPECIHIDAELQETTKLLRRTLRGNINVNCTIEPETWRVLADLAQLESAILNLAVNARDAMPDGGTLNIAASNLCIEVDRTEEHDDIAPGEYVVIAVRDNGTGIAPEVIERVFDPFFTTKGAKGTGLGLSQVFGFAKQSGGYLKLESVLGLGTVVRLYLPRASNDIESSRAATVPLERLGQHRNSEFARNKRETREGAKI